MNLRAGGGRAWHRSFSCRNPPEERALSCRSGQTAGVFLGSGRPHQAVAGVRRAAAQYCGRYLIETHTNQFIKTPEVFVLP